MSHSIWIELDSQNIHVNACNDIINEIKEINKWVDKSIANENEKLIKDAQKIIDYIQATKKTNNNAEYISFLARMDSIRKAMVNLSNFNKEIISNNFYKNLGENQDFNLLDKIKKHGILTNEVIEYLRSNNIAITNTNFDKYINIVETNILDNEKIKKYTKQSLDEIQKLNISSELKLSLSKKIKEIKDINQLKDVGAYLVSKEAEWKKVKRFSTDVVNSLKKQGFAINQKIQPIWKIDDNDNIVLKISFINSKNNTVSINFDSTMHISYKLGNYIGHACEETTKKLLDDIIKIGYTYKIIDIKRDFEQPKLMAQSLKKERKK